MVFPLAPAGAALLAAVGFLVDGRPGAPLSFVFGHASAFITLFDMFGLTLLFVGVTGLVATGHGVSPILGANLSARKRFLFASLDPERCRNPPLGTALCVAS